MKGLLNATSLKKKKSMTFSKTRTNWVICLMTAKFLTLYRSMKGTAETYSWPTWRQYSGSPSRNKTRTHNERKAGNRQRSSRISQMRYNHTNLLSGPFSYPSVWQNVGQSDAKDGINCDANEAWISKSVQWLRYGLNVREVVVRFATSARYFSPPERQKNEMGGAYNAYGGGRWGVYRILVGKPEGKRPLGRPTRRWRILRWIFRK